jgi:hypothetical protein
MWEPQRFTTIWAFMACYRDSFSTDIRNEAAHIYTFAINPIVICDACSDVIYFRLFEGMQSFKVGWRVQSYKFGLSLFICLVRQSVKFEVEFLFMGQTQYACENPNSVVTSNQYNKM